MPIVDSIEKVQDIESISLYFDPLFHLIALAWANSVYYTNIVRFIGFLQQWTNLIILKVKFFNEERKYVFGLFVDSRFTSTQ